jgi:DNA-binding XRE family transcriptional regulator
MAQDVLSIALGRMVAFHRKKMGWNQGKLAEQVNATQSTISRVERGEVLPDALLFRDLAKAFGTTTEDLYKTMDVVSEKAKELAKIVSRDAPKKSGDWWGVALAVVGTVGMIALIGAAVAALMGDEETAVKELVEDDQD